MKKWEKLVTQDDAERDAWTRFCAIFDLNPRPNEKAFFGVDMYGMVVKLIEDLRAGEAVYIDTRARKICAIKLEVDRKERR